MRREEDVMNILNELNIFYTDLNRLIVDYDKLVEWEDTSYNTWGIDYPFGIVGDENYMYACQPDSNIITKYNLQGELLGKQSLQSPAGIDIDIKKSLLYIAGKAHVTLISLQSFETSLRSWALPTHYSWNFRGIKLDGETLYLTLRDPHNIFVCDRNDGKVLNKFGSEVLSSSKGNFNQPCGLTLGPKSGLHGVHSDDEYLYICDNQNHRVQILTKDEGHYVSQFGRGGADGRSELRYPNSIYYSNFDSIYYVGDWFSIQLFRLSGERIKRIGNQNQFNSVYGIWKCENNDQLYVSDLKKRRIQIFRRR